MSAFLTHFQIRFKAVFTDPYALIVLVLTGAASLMYWPGLIEPAQVRESLVTEGEGLNQGFLMLIWVFIWPMLGGNLVGGTVAGGGREAMAQRPLPSLPVGLRTRVLAEAILVLLFAFLARIPSFMLGEAVHQGFYLPGMLDASQLSRDAFLQRSFVGAAIIFPAVLIWTAPSKNVQFYFLVRPMVLIALFILAMLSGLMASIVPCVLTSLVISSLFLLFLGREIDLPVLRNKKVQPIETRWRPAMNPEVRLRRDFWLRPLTAGALLLLLEFLLLALDYSFELPDFGLYFGSCFVFGFLFSFVGLRPMGLYFIETALCGKTGSPKTGDAGRAWTVLPVRFSAMTRGFYLHGLIAGTLLWLGVLLVNGIATYLETGEFAFKDPDGDSAEKYLVPFLAAVPCLAGGVTSMAVGARLRSYLSIVAAVGILISHVAMLIAKVPTPFRVAVLVSLALVGGVPALTYLRARHNPNSACDTESIKSTAPTGLMKG